MIAPVPMMIALIVLFAAIVLSATTGRLWPAREKSAQQKIHAREARKMLPVFDAAQSALRIAQGEKLPLGAVAQNQGDAVAWFARSICGVIPAYARGEAGDFEKRAAGDGDPQSLYIRKRDLAKYLRWARTVL